MEVTYYIEGGEDRDEYLIVSVRQGANEVRRILGKDVFLSNRRDIKVNPDVGAHATKVVIPMWMTRNTAFSESIFNLAYSEGHGFVADQ
jgi:hypothetical protein